MSEKAPQSSTGAPSGLRRFQRPAGLALIAAGVVLLVLVGGYYLYGIRAKAAIDDYSSERARPARIVSASTTLPEAPARPSPVAAAAPAPSPTPQPAVESRRDEAQPTPTATEAPDIPTPAPGPAAATSTPPAAASGQRTGPSGLAQALRQETPTPEPTPMPTPTPDYAAIIARDVDGQIAASEAEALKYSPVPANEVLAGSTLPATRIRIPVVSIDSEIKELEVIDQGDSRAWETPKEIVGHIPTTAFPGSRGHGWYFGHLESPFQGEGNVFGRLPDLAELFTSRTDSSFYIFLESEERKFVYQIYRTEILHRDDFALHDSKENDITLVTCYPRFIYDHRLLVTAALVGVRES